ncbi:hypothetical protein DdX_15142 [Ditylenchus destructor]|uniref:Transmembrane protein n=1 Tax=Ditylenchus destructor TaxID=166010 RepID=A0AAD4MVW3_9BILA|nr:hypothetical protein DdX_15142 [Ditylenchus destructor]
MQSLRRIPACAQVRVLFLNRSYAASTSSTDALVRLNAISRMNSRSVLRFDDRNLIQVACLSFQRRGFQTAVQNSGGKKQETSSSNILSSFFNLLVWNFCGKNLEGVDREKLSEDEMKIEKQIGIESSNEVPIKVEGEQQLWFTWVQSLSCIYFVLSGGFFILMFIRNVRKARNIVKT